MKNLDILKIKLIIVIAFLAGCNAGDEQTVEKRTLLNSVKGNPDSIEYHFAEGNLDSLKHFQDDNVISIWNINIKKTGSKKDYGERVRNIAQEITEIDNSSNRKSELFGLVEAFYRVEGWLTKNHMREKILCPNDNAEVYTHECFYRIWSSNTGALGDQYGDVSILANKNIFQLESGTNYIKRTIGPTGRTWIQYKLIGARLRIIGTDYVLPFYTVHLPTRNAWRAEQRQKQCGEDIVKIVKNNWIRGDLTPIVVGDFNFTRTIRKPPFGPYEPYYIMEEYFNEIGWTLCGRDDIELIWVGKREKFPGAIGELRAIDFAPGDEFNTNFGIGQRAQSSDGPSLFNLNGRLYIAWSGYGDDNRLQLISSTNGLVWDDKIYIAPTASKTSPSLTYFNNKFYIAWTTLQNYLNIMSSSDGVNWGNKIKFKTEPNTAISNDGPSLLVANNRLYIIWSGAGSQHRLFWMSTANGTTWTAREEVRDSGSSNHSPSITYFKNKFYVGWTSLTDPFYLKIISSSNGIEWGDRITFRSTFPGHFTDHNAPRVEFMPYRF